MANENSNVNYVGGMASVIGIGVNAVQRAQEKDRQERIDAYNKALNDRNFHATQIQNNPSYQMQRLKDAGWNPLAQGATPEFSSPVAGDILSPTPMETSSVGNSVITSAQGMLDAELRSESLQVQRDTLENERRKIDIQEKAMLFEQAQTRVKHVVDMWNSGGIEHTDERKEEVEQYIREQGFDFGFDSDGLVYLKGVADVDLILKNAGYVLQQTQTEKARTTETEANAKLASSRASRAEALAELEVNQKAVDVLNALRYGEIQLQDKRSRELTNDLQEIYNDIAKSDWELEQIGASNLPDYLKSKIRSVINRNPVLFKAFVNQLASENLITWDQCKDFNKWYYDMLKTNKWIDTFGNGVNALQGVANIISVAHKMKPVSVQPPMRVGFRP